MTKINLPITGFKGEILGAVNNANRVVIITAETGAGKTTQVSQFLLKAGYRVIMTQPRRLAARTVADRIAEEWGCELGETVGYRTAQDRQDSDETELLVVTDGLALVRELMGHQDYHDEKEKVLLLDEVHEWNRNIETLVAWVKAHLAQNSNFKVILMSATLEAEKLSEFFDGAPIISVPGRTFPVEEQKPGESPLADVVRLAGEGRNVLYFLPGESEINLVEKQLSEITDLGAVVLPLHGKMSKEKQALCFKNYRQPKIVLSTNVAQTSVTIDDIDAVVDSGVEKRIELVDGVEGLYLRPISQADSKQRKGRAGRVKPGIYIDHCETPYDERREFPVAEIHRVRLDQTVLRLAMAGFDMEDLEFFHQPDITEIHEAKRVLKALGCMDENGKVTDIGRAVSKMPISVQYGRMIVEAEERGVVEDVIKIASILEQGGITSRFIKVGGERMRAKSLWLPLTDGETESDILAQLNVFENAHKLSKKELYENGVFAKAFYFTKERIRLVRNSLRKSVRHWGTTGNREDILKSVMAGMVDHLYQYKYGEYVNGDDTARRINDDSVVSGGDWLVGKPFDLEIQGRYEPFTIHLVNMVTKVDPIILAEVASQLVTMKAGLNPRFDSEKGCVVSTTKTFFNGVEIKEEEVESPEHPEAGRILDEQAWKDFNGESKATLTFPDDLSVEIPEVEEKVYADSEIDGSPLVAYRYFYVSSTSFYQRWTREQDYAESENQKTVKKLAKLKSNWKAGQKYASLLGELNRTREEFGLPVIKIEEYSFTHNKARKDYSDENIKAVEKETALAKVFQELNGQREELGLSRLSINSDGEFNLNGYKKITEENLEFVRKSIAEKREALKKEEAESRELAEVIEEFNILNQRRSELFMTELSVYSGNEFYLDGYHKLTFENLQIIRDDIFEKEQRIQREANAKAESVKKSEEKKEMQEGLDNPFASLANLLEK